MSGTLPFMEPWEEYKAEPILEMLETGGFNLKLDLLDEIFDNVRNIPVAIISVAGPFRKGKSFMLNLLADYLLENQSQNWYSNGKRQIKSVFGFRGGTERDTVGIHLTKKPFMLKNKEEKEVAVFLMDTQGMFDFKTTATNNSVIFALSTLLSSVQIYNLSGLIQENDLQHLQVFTKYAKRVADEKRHVNASTAPFQGLVFLLRNWEQLDLDYGFKGGNKYLSTVMEPHIEENRLVRQNLSNSFSDVVCSLIPHPGKKIGSRKPDNTEVCFSDIDDDFMIEVDALVKYLFSKENLIVKKLNGWKLTGESIIDLAIEYTKILSTGEMPKVDTIVKSNENADFFSKIRQFESEYKMNMLKKMGETAVNSLSFNQMHEECLAIARKQFQEHDVLENAEESKANLELMEKNIGVMRISLNDNNNAKMANITTLLDEKVNIAGRVYYEQLEEIAGNHVAVARRKSMAEANAFFALAAEGLDKHWVNEKRHALKIEFDKQHKQFLKENEMHKPSTEHTMSILFTKSVQKYQELMEQAIEQSSENVKYEHVHRKAFENALQFFDSSPIGADTAYKTAKRKCLEDELLKQLGNYQEQFETDQAILEWRAVAKDCYKTTFQNVQMKYMDDQHLQKLHVKALERAKESFSKLETKLTVHFNQHMKALELDMMILFENVKETNLKNMKAIQKKLHIFYNKLEADYLDKLFEVIRKRYANINTVNVRHENFKEAIKIEVAKIIPFGNLRQEIIQRCLGRLDKKFKEVKSETANFEKGLLEMPGHVIGLGFKTLVGAFIGPGKATKMKLDLSVIPSVKYLQSLVLGR